MIVRDEINTLHADYVQGDGEERITVKCNAANQMSSLDTECGYN